MTIKKYIIPIITIILLSLTSSLFSQVGKYNHPELRWFTFETEHFIFHYHKGTEKTANRFANTAEQVYDTITKLYNYYPPEKLHIIINDYEDYANGGAYYYNNKISLWASNLDTELRGTHNWVRNVFTHEFSHMIQLNTSMKLNSYVPGIYFQWTGYESEKRKDVLTGYPNIITSYNIPMNIIPNWFAEGVAQNQNIDTLYFDFWDSNRDMLQRERFLTDQDFSYAKLSDFGNKSSHEAETVYNTGFSFVNYLFEEYGRDVPEKISREMGKLTVWSFEQAIENITGIDGEKLYNDWVMLKKNQYKRNIKSVEVNLVEGVNWSDSAFVNTNSVLSNDGTKLAYLSTVDNGEITFYRRDLFIKDLKTDSVKKVIPSVILSSFSWDNKDENIYFSRSKNHGLYGNDYFDIYKYNFKDEKEEQLTHGLRAFNPSISPDGKTIAFVSSIDGTQNLYLLDLETKKISNITNKDDGIQYYTAKWSNNSKKILIAYSDEFFGRDIAILDTEGKSLYNHDDKYDKRNPVFSRDQKSIYYASDDTGIYNIYRINIETGKKDLITNVRGGAMYPELLDDTTLVYSNYKGVKFNLYKLENIKPLDEKLAYYIDYKIPNFNSAEYKSMFTDTNVDYVKDSKRYTNDYEHIFLIPRLNYDNKTFKPGMYFFMNDYLEKVSLFGGFAMNSDYDYDLFGMTEFKFLLTTIYGMGINIVKHDNDNTYVNENIIIDVELDPNGNEVPIYQENTIDFTFDLKQYNFGIKSPITYSPKIFGFSFGAIDYDFYYSQSLNKASADYGDFIIKYDFFKDKSFHFDLNIKQRSYGLHSNIAPSNGREIFLSYSRHITKYITGFELNSDYGTLQEKYLDYDYNRFEMKWKEHFSLPLDAALSVKLKGSIIDKDSIATFYNEYIGGLTGLRGYSFYSVGGTRTAVSSMQLNIPIIKRVNWKFGFLNFKKFFAGIFVDSGLAWTAENDGDLENYLKTDLRTNVGLNLRLYAISFYGMPTAIDYSIAYGFDEFEQNEVTYGKEFRNYLSILFNFQDFF